MQFLKKNHKYPLIVSFNLLIAGWTIIIAGIMFWSYESISTETFNLARREAYKGYEKDILFIQWATMHGGVYVPITGESQPNPYLSNIPDRDISTPSNKKLTLMNPEYMAIQMHEFSFAYNKTIGHITSLNSLRMENNPDKWEAEALKSFEKGAKEISGFDTIKNEKYVRYMAPLVTEEKCLQCHAVQGYKVGDIRGGISSSVPWKNYAASIQSQAVMLFLGYGVLWLIGFAGVLIVKKNFIIYVIRRDQDKEQMKMLIDELTETKVKLEKINWEKDKLFSIISHDLKSPFAGFMGLTEILAKDINSFTQDELSVMIKDMNGSAKNLFKLLTNLLDWARIQQGLISFEPAEIQLFEKVSNNISVLIKRGEQKGIEIINDIQVNHKVYVDEAMLDSILRNLLSNAIKFTSRGGKIILSSKDAGNKMIEISVKDNGIGIPESLIKKLFRVEEKTGRPGTEGELSTGLGLLLCEEFVEKNNGKIWAESKEGKGTTFYFTLPSSKLIN